MELYLDTAARFLQIFNGTTKFQIPNSKFQIFTFFY